MKCHGSPSKKWLIIVHHSWICKQNWSRWKIQFWQNNQHKSRRKSLLGDSDSELVSSKWIPWRDSVAEKRWLDGTGTLNGRIDMLLLLPNIVLVLDASLLPELPVRCSNCSILEVTEAELGRKWTIAAILLLLWRGARNHSGSCSAPSIDNRINVASTQALQVGWLPGNLQPIKTLASFLQFCMRHQNWSFSRCERTSDAGKLSSQNPPHFGTEEGQRLKLVDQWLGVTVSVEWFKAFLVPLSTQQQIINCQPSATAASGVTRQNNCNLGFSTLDPGGMIRNQVEKAGKRRQTHLTHLIRIDPKVALADNLELRFHSSIFVKWISYKETLSVNSLESREGHLALPISVASVFFPPGKLFLSKHILS